MAGRTAACTFRLYAFFMQKNHQGPIIMPRVIAFVANRGALGGWGRLFACVHVWDNAV